MYFLQRIQQRGLLGLYQPSWKNKKSTLREQCAYQKNLLTLYQKGYQKGTDKHLTWTSI
jgi:hypothetical protein